MSASKSLLSCDLDDNVCFAEVQGLKYVYDRQRGYTRACKGKHFVFFDTKGKPVKEEAEIARIRKLAVPPAYKDVWICPYANGHIQATGIDARGRKQYRYHAEWRAVRDASKFHHTLAFGDALPQIRAQTAKHMAQHKLTRERVLATVVTLLEKTMIRIGNSEYARENKSYGLTTLREKHVDVSGQTIRFQFMGKSGKEWNLKLNDRRVARTLAQCQEIPGQELFKYQDETGNTHTISSTDVNQYLQEITGENFTAKDFRTWAGTVLAAVALQEYSHYDSEAEAKKNIITAIESVSKKLGNTPAICRKCYVHPEILDAYLDGSLIKQIDQDINKSLKEKYDCLSKEEILVLAFLKNRLKQSPAKKS